MNKVMKAISDLKGDLDNCAMNLSGNANYLTINPDNKYNTFIGKECCDDCDQLVCTIKEFNETLEHLETNFGASCGYDDYIADFWSKAPDGAEYYSPEDSSFLPSYLKNINENSYCKLCPVTDNGWVYIRSSLTKGRTLIKRPSNTIKKPEQAKPVYTQAMFDSGELPSVGMECMAYIYADTSKQGNPMNSWADGEFIGKCKSSNGGFCFVFKAKDDIHHVINANSHFKPIDQRTKKEKAIDDLMKKSVVFCNNEVMRSCFSIAFDEWVGE